MKCCVVLNRMDVSWYHLPSDEVVTELPPVDLSLVKAEPVSPTEAMFNSFFPPPPVVNTIKETKARPLSKIKSHFSKPLPPLGKIKAAKSIQPKPDCGEREQDISTMNIVELLRRCQLCKVLLVDCMKGLAAQPHPLVTSKEKNVPTKQKKEKKKKKHKVWIIIFYLWSVIYLNLFCALVARQHLCSLFLEFETQRNGNTGEAEPN